MSPSNTAQTSQTYTFRGKTLQEALEEFAMSIPLLLAITICPALLGTQEAIRQSQSKSKREEHRSRRCNLVVSCVKQSIRSRDIHGKLVVLKDNKLYITTSVPSTEDGVPTTAGGGYPFAGYYLPYPDKPYEGLVSTISDDPPMLNWIYVDKDTYEVKYGVRADAQPNITGPFDCTRQDRRMTLQGWEGFVAVEEFPGIWALYFDKDDDGLVTKVPMGTRVLEIELTRREKKERKPEPEDLSQAQTLDEKMKEHQEQAEREAREKEEFYRKQEEERRQAAEAAAAAENGQVAEELEERPDGVGDTDDQAEDVAQASVTFDLDKLRLAVPGGSSEPSGSNPRSPSVVTDNASFWSSARKLSDISDSESVTAASSIAAGIDEADSVSGDPGYKRPYVEDVEDEGDDDVERGEEEVART
ncbi:hypothetical protein GGS23DRAFT_576919 [Durotheca rogersii]|uniref:uncharacterized protein n=1 Tax=Durotheca rogersii TaxID=419775 RepID=UPI00221FA542|nr:uncharacterized protein GGS23DRAFT_576919 [Durotheca rogersii]KAI5861466.1 hypothetical protein GGS23DRAFT_576919 [Durotheca rogersii]